MVMGVDVTVAPRLATSPRPKRLMVVIGTRPEVIKLAPVVHEARARGTRFEVDVVTTGQHRELVHQMLRELDLTAEVDLAIMSEGQNLCQVTTRALGGLYEAIDDRRPDWVIVQGDTATTLAGALAAFYRRVRVAHVEAGLRTWDKAQPFPEEINRCLVTRLADAHFAPSDWARQNLLREGVPAEVIWKTGNTAIDALRYTLARGREAALPALPGERLVLVTTHRRENHGEPLERILQAIRTLAERFPDVGFLFPVHPSPHVQQAARSYLGDHPRVVLAPPLGYTSFVAAMAKAHLILSDSGGIQEEGPALGKPVLVLRETTERPEAVRAGGAKLVGSDPERIVQEVAQLLEHPELYARMAQTRSPYGDGRAAERILDVLGAL